MTHCELFRQTLDTIGIKYVEKWSYEYTYFIFADGDVFFEFNPDGSLASHP